MYIYETETATSNHNWPGPAWLTVYDPTEVYVHTTHRSWPVLLTRSSNIWVYPGYLQTRQTC